MAGELRARLAAEGLARHADALAALARPALRLELERAEERSIPVGACKLGGIPDLPYGARRPFAGGRAIPFLAQLDLAALAPLLPHSGLPPAGLLSFFYREARWDAAAGRAIAEASAVVYTPAGQRRLRRGPSAAALFIARGLQRLAGGGSELGEFPTCRVTLRPLLTLPSHLHPDVIALALDDGELEAYHELRAAVGHERDAAHQVLGWPGFFQPDERDPSEAPQWTHLLTLDSDEAAGMSWGDAGRLHFVLPASALEEGRFDRAEAVFDSP